jgi:hypothetical protein
MTMTGGEVMDVTTTMMITAAGAAAGVTTMKTMTMMRTTMKMDDDDVVANDDVAKPIVGLIVRVSSSRVILPHGCAKSPFRVHSCFQGREP